jgi:ankyrin repeat protein
LENEDSKGNCILFYTLLDKNYQMAEFLIDKGAQIDYVNKHGLTPLHLMVELFLEEQT